MKCHLLFVKGTKYRSLKKLVKRALPVVKDTKFAETFCDHIWIQQSSLGVQKDPMFTRIQWLNR